VPYRRMTLDDISVRPSRLQFPALLAAMRAAPAPRRPTGMGGAGARDEGEDGEYSMRQCGSERSRDVPRNLGRQRRRARSKLAAVRFNPDNGKLGEFAIEALDGRSSEGARQESDRFAAQIPRYPLVCFEWWRNSPTPGQQPFP
jgi:hypothetical protein